MGRKNHPTSLDMSIKVQVHLGKSHVWAIKHNWYLILWDGGVESLFGKCPNKHRFFPFIFKINPECQWKQKIVPSSQKMESLPTSWSMKLDNRSGPSARGQNSCLEKAHFLAATERKLKCWLLKGWKVKSAPDFHLISGFWHSRAAEGKRRWKKRHFSQFLC